MESNVEILKKFVEQGVDVEAFEKQLPDDLLNSISGGYEDFWMILSIVQTVITQIKKGSLINIGQQSQIIMLYIVAAIVKNSSIRSNMV